MAQPAANRKRVPPPYIFWYFLLLLTLTELLVVVSPLRGLVLYLLLLLSSMLYSAIAPRVTSRRLALALMLPALIRILSLSLPLSAFPPAAWYAVIGAPLLLSAILAIRVLGLSATQLGLRWGKPLPTLFVLACVLPIGALEFAILRPAALVGPSPLAHLLLALSLVLFTGVAEELIFRGIFQVLAPAVLGRWAFIYVSLLFAALHVGHRSLVDVVVVFGVGLLFAFVVWRSGSLLAVALAHSLVNITLFQLMPLVAQQSSGALATMVRTGVVVSAAIATGAGIALLAIALRERVGVGQRFARYSREQRS